MEHYGYKNKAAATTTKKKKRILLVIDRFETALARICFRGSKYNL